MALELTPDRPLGYQAPGFQLQDVVTGTDRSFDDVRGSRATVVVFMCNHCPYVVHVLPQVLQLARAYEPFDVRFVAISSNDVQRYPDDAPEKMRALAIQKQFPFPYLYDETQEVARAYDAACTPDFHVFDAEGRCCYRGRLDESTPGNGIPVDGRDLSMVLEALLGRGPMPMEQYPSRGCSIKWKE